MPGQSTSRSYLEVAEFLGIGKAMAKKVLRPWLIDGKIRTGLLWELIEEGKLARQSESSPARQAIGAQQRMRILDRDGKRCRYCGHVTFSTTRCIDHILPWSRGGRNYDVNLVICCKACNILKGTKTLNEANMVLRNCPDCNENLYHVQRGLGAGRLDYQVPDIRLLMDQ